TVTKVGAAKPPNRPRKPLFCNVSEAPTKAIPAKRRRGVLWLVAAVLISVVVFHAPILRGVAKILVVDAPFDTGDLFVVRNDTESLAAAAELFQEGGFDRVLLSPNRPGRTEQ